MNLTYKNNDRKVKIDVAHGDGVVVASMKTHEGNTLVQERVWKVLWNVATGVFVFGTVEPP